jgi:uncharacterized protein YecT (DUF1311 family)
MKLLGPHRYFSFLLGTVLVSGAISAPSVLSDRLDCDRAEITAAMRQCENLRYEKADSELNRIYQRLSDIQDEIGRKKLQLSQRAWIKYRDLNAEFIGDSMRGGSLQPLLIVTTKADMTEERSEELAKLLD